MAVRSFRRDDVTAEISRLETAEKPIDRLGLSVSGSQFLSSVKDVAFQTFNGDQDTYWALRWKLLSEMRSDIDDLGAILFKILGDDVDSGGSVATTAIEQAGAADFDTLVDIHESLDKFLGLDEDGQRRLLADLRKKYLRLVASCKNKYGQLSVGPSGQKIRRDFDDGKASAQPALRRFLDKYLLFRNGYTNFMSATGALYSTEAQVRAAKEALEDNFANAELNESVLTMGVTLSKMDSRLTRQDPRAPKWEGVPLFTFDELPRIVSGWSFPLATGSLSETLQVDGVTGTLEVPVSAGPELLGTPVIIDPVTFATSIVLASAEDMHIVVDNTTIVGSIAPGTYNTVTEIATAMSAAFPTLGVSIVSGQIRVTQGNVGSARRLAFGMADFNITSGLSYEVYPAVYGSDTSISDITTTVVSPLLAAQYTPIASGLTATTTIGGAVAVPADDLDLVEVGDVLVTRSAAPARYRIIAKGASDVTVTPAVLHEIDVTTGLVAAVDTFDFDIIRNRLVIETTTSVYGTSDVGITSTALGFNNDFSIGFVDRCFIDVTALPTRGSPIRPNDVAILKADGTGYTYSQITKTDYTDQGVTLFLDPSVRWSPTYNLAAPPQWGLGPPLGVAFPAVAVPPFPIASVSILSLGAAAEQLVDDTYQDLWEDLDALSLVPEGGFNLNSAFETVLFAYVALSGYEANAVTGIERLLNGLKEDKLDYAVDLLSTLQFREFFDMTEGDVSNRDKLEAALSIVMAEIEPPNGGYYMVPGEGTLGVFNDKPNNSLEEWPVLSED
jgi:hypothetical protein